MKIEIRSHCWPATPELREIKIFIDETLISSSFLSQNKIWDLAKQLRYLDQDLMNLANSMDGL